MPGTGALWEINLLNRVEVAAACAPWGLLSKGPGLYYWLHISAYIFWVKTRDGFCSCSDFWQKSEISWWDLELKLLLCLLLCSSGIPLSQLCLGCPVTSTFRHCHPSSISASLHPSCSASFWPFLFPRCVSICPSPLYFVSSKCSLKAWAGSSQNLRDFWSLTFFYIQGSPTVFVCWTHLAWNINLNSPWDFKII